MVGGVDIRVQHGGGLGISAPDNNEWGVENVCLEAGGNQALSLLVCGHQDLTAHVPALLRTRLLVLNVYPRRAILNKHFRQLHDGCEPTMARVCICHYGIKVIYEGGLGPLFRCPAAPLLILPTVVELLCAEELIYLVGDRVVGVVRNIGPWLVGRRGRGAGLPAAHVHGVQVLGHLDHLDRVHGAEGVGAGAHGLVLAQPSVQLLRHPGAVEMHQLGALHLHHILGAVVPPCVLEALLLHPDIHLSDPLGIVCIFRFANV
mmetsp:Transcript_50853/g.147638  ORF Transcript_50853/g.147638 Transcript_50853/m.147638 type:complete len:261 (+) Transcript_50853:1210-1992(+)